MLKRKLFFSERIVYLDGMKDLGYLSVLGVMRLEDPITLNQLQAALRLLQMKHPSFRAHITPDKCIQYDDEIEHPIPVEVVERTSDMHWFDVQNEVIKTQFDYQKSPLMKVVWVKNDYEPVSDLIYVMPHLVADGKSLGVIHRDLMIFLNNPDKEPVPYPPFANTAEFVPKARFSFMDKIRCHLYCWKYSHQAKLRVLNEPLQPRGKNFYSLRLPFGQETSEAIRTMARAHGVATGNVIGMLLFIAYRRHIPTNYKYFDDEHFIFSYLMDIRHFFPAVKRTMVFPYSPSTGVKVELPANNDVFWLSVSKMETHLRNDIVSRFRNVEGPSIAHSYARLHYFFECSKYIMTWWIKYNFYLNEEVELSYSDFGTYPSHMSGAIRGRMTWMNVIEPWHNPTYIGLCADGKEFVMGFISDEMTIPQETMQRIVADFRADLAALISREKSSGGEIGR